MDRYWRGRHERVPKRGYTKPGIRARIVEGIRRTIEEGVSGC
jgi:hypothetical protein